MTCWKVTWASGTRSWVSRWHFIWVGMGVWGRGLLGPVGTSASVPPFCSLPHPPAATMVELGKDKRNPDELAEALDERLGDFAFPDEFVFDVWGAIGDAKVGRY